MSVCDPVADMLCRLRNGAAAGRAEVELPHSALKGELARLMKKEGYIQDYVTEGAGGRKTLRVVLRYAADGRPVIQGLRRVSKPGLRRYVPAARVPRVLGGLGTAVLSTSRGIMTGREARQSKLGGEVLCYIW